MEGERLNRVLIAADVVLDGRLALFHERDRWLAVADVHFGYELSQRAAGNLFPLWGMQTIEDRLFELLRDYEPSHLVLLGDLVHNRAGGEELSRLVKKLSELTDVVLIAGNHDRHLRNLDLAPSWQSNGFHFHHGHCAAEKTRQIQIIGHHHPAAVVRDGAGLRLKLPAFVQEDECWVLPAFSPWAAGTEWPWADKTVMWLCSPRRVLRLENTEPRKV
jgi:putative SbcD/Mre11-related phosphoesterase